MDGDVLEGDTTAALLFHPPKDVSSVEFFNTCMCDSIREYTCQVNVDRVSSRRASVFMMGRRRKEFRFSTFLHKFSSLWTHPKVPSPIFSSRAKSLMRRRMDRERSGCSQSRSRSGNMSRQRMSPGMPKEKSQFWKAVKQFYCCGLLESAAARIRCHVRIDSRFRPKSRKWLGHSRFQC